MKKNPQTRTLTLGEVAASGRRPPPMIESAPRGYTVGGYSLDAYCENHGRTDGEFGRNPCDQGQGIAQTASGAARDLRRQGWTFKVHADGSELVRCPVCTKRKR